MIVHSRTVKKIYSHIKSYSKTSKNLVHQSKILDKVVRKYIKIGKARVLHSNIR